MKEERFSLVRGVVVSDNDPYCGNRIKVKLGNFYDGSKSDEELTYCSPLLPKLIHVMPKPGEMVLVILEKSDSGESNRFYIGPLLSQPQRFYNEMSRTAQSFLDNPEGDGNTTLENPNKGDNTGSIPENDDIALIGRNNCDVVLKEHELRLLCGHKGNAAGSTDKTLIFNKVSPAFIQAQYEKRVDKSTNLSDNTYESSINVCADRINLISRHGDFNLGELDNCDLITQDKMQEILSKAHPLVYGDSLVKYLDDFRSAFINHKHAYPMLKPIQNDKIQKILDVNFEDMLSKAVKTC